MTNNPAKTPQEQQRAAMRTVWILALFALALFGATIYGFLR
jgi:hypothetical protein